MERFEENGSADEIAVLGWLHNLGATDEGRALTVEEISWRIDMEPTLVRRHLEKLVSMDYVSKRVDREDRFFLRPQGILRVAKTYT